MQTHPTENGSATQRPATGRPVSMCDVAAAAGVSQQTVSRVANGAPNVSEKTRKQVLDAMQRLGFRETRRA